MPAVTLASAQAEWPRDLWDPQRPLMSPGKPIRVQPVLMYVLPRRREMASWKSWGGIQTEESAAQEASRILKELTSVAEQAGFPIEVLPVAKVQTLESAAAARNSGADVTIIYPATGPGNLLRACIPENGQAIIFVRHRSGPVYYWYEALSVRYLKTERPQPAPANPADAPRLHVDDVVVDDSAELLWRLRSFYGVKNLLGSRIVALGGAQGKYARDAVQVARERFKLDILEVKYDDFQRRIRAALADRSRVSRAVPIRAAMALRGVSAGIATSSVRGTIT
jgi:hypothetical protein